MDLKKEFPFAHMNSDEFLQLSEIHSEMDLELLLTLQESLPVLFNQSKKD